MIRTIFRDDRVLFGPLRDADLAVIAQEPAFAGYGLAASAANGAVEVYASFPQDQGLATKLKDWMLRNHILLTV